MLSYQTLLAPAEFQDVLSAESVDSGAAQWRPGGAAAAAPRDDGPRTVLWHGQAGVHGAP